MNIRPTFVAALTLAASLPAFADTKINDNLMINGYVAGAWEYQKAKSTPGTDSLFDGTKDTPSADALKTAFNFTFKPVTGVVSLYYVPNLPKNELSVLDAYVTYDTGGGYSVTGGKFLSYLGYEAFDTVNMTQITYGAVTVGTLGAIPAYHTGLRLDYGDKDVGYGLAVVDSVYSNTFVRGDGELSHSAGLEGYAKYTGAKDLTLWAGFAYDTANNQLLSAPHFPSHEVLTLDFWAEYKATKDATLAAEYCNKNGGDFSKGNTWLAYLNYACDAKTSVVLRISGEDLSGKTKTIAKNFVQYTVGPSLKLSENLTVRGEVSYYSYTGASASNKILYGLQGVFKF
jgi:hypothetical protein